MLPILGNPKIDSQYHFLISTKQTVHLRLREMLGILQAFEHKNRIGQFTNVTRLW